MDLTLLLSILVAFLLIILLSLTLYARWNFGTLEALGIAVVPPHFLLGSTYNAHKEVTYEVDMERFKKYGPVYGVYEGREAQVHICDPEIIKHVLVKDFDHFQLRRFTDFGNPILNEMAGFLQELPKWKLVRKLALPCLTPLKIKEMSSGMKETLLDFMQFLKEKLDSTGDSPLKVDVKDTMYTLSTNVILRCIFNIKVPNSNDPNNYFVDLIKRLQRGTVAAPPQTLFYVFGLAFPFFKKFQFALDGRAAEEFGAMYRKILNQRRKSDRNLKDFTETALGWMDRLDSSEFKKLNITENTLLMQALLMFLAGVDQLSYFLASLFLHIGENPDVEIKLLQEIDTFRLKHNGEVNREDLDELPYLSACINESLRMGSVFMRLERVCTKDWECGTLKMKKGMVAMIPIWATHRNPDYFPNPDKFDPERFLGEDKDKLNSALMTFGHGPKSCIGTRFATESLIFIAAHIYQGVTFRWNSKTEFKVTPGNLFLGAAGPILMDVVRRESFIKISN